MLLQSGLADAEDEEDFDVKLDSLKSVWEKKAPGFQTGLPEIDHNTSRSHLLCPLEKASVSKDTSIQTVWN